MSAPFSSFFRNFISTGITPEMNELEMRRVRLLNTFYLIGTATLIASIIETFIVDGKEEALIILSLGCIFEFGLIFLLLKKTKAAEFHLLTSANLILFVFENHYGPAAGTFLFYFPYILIIAFLVDFKRFVYAAFHLVFALTLMIAGLFFRHQLFYKPISPEEAAASFTFNLVLSAIMIAVIALVILRFGYTQHLEFIARMNERKNSEDALKMALKEKETLIAEVHHRVKNNLAVISSLLNLQMNQVKNEYTKNVLLESRNRVASMALIHQKLYQHSNIEQIDFSSYATELVDEIKNSYPRSSAGKIEVELHAEHLPLSLTKAVPCGLILNELLSNCYKHAFPEEKQGKIIIRFFSLKGNPERFVIEVEDNGIGIPEGFEIAKQESLGISIIQSLAGQIDGKIELSRKASGGTICRVNFTA
jgi:two-component sensor histidine kinase